MNINELETNLVLEERAAWKVFNDYENSIEYKESQRKLIELRSIWCNKLQTLSGLRLYKQECQ